MGLDFFGIVVRLQAGTPMADPKAPNPASDTNHSLEAPARAGKWLRAAAFFIGSAAFGGLAVALWDRKTLTAMRGKTAEPPPACDEDVD
jgi:hypothetical protein